MHHHKPLLQPVAIWLTLLSSFLPTLAITPTRHPIKPVVLNIIPAASAQCCCGINAKQILRAGYVWQALAAILSLTHEDERSSSGYDMTQLGMLVPSAGAFLIDLLDMSSLQSSPMSIEHPAKFMDACQGMHVPRNGAVAQATVL